MSEDILAFWLSFCHCCWFFLCFVLSVIIERCNGLKCLREAEEIFRSRYGKSFELSNFSVFN